MLGIKKYAAIDVGSNAVRLLVSTIIEPKGEEPIFKKTSLVRVPIRLGEDVFLRGRISKANANRMLEAMKAYDLLMKVHKIERFKACATSAMRSAKNGVELSKKILEETGIEIEIIDGKHEAAIIATTDLHELIKDDQTYLYVDVGGGSTEFTLFAEGKTVTSRSFKLGTVRLLNDMVDKNAWKEVEDWVKNVTKKYQHIQMIGSGGNINNIFKTSGRKPGKPLSYKYIHDYYQLLTSMTYEERISKLILNTDRADVIVPATKIYLSAMRWSKATKIFVPKIGLVDGIVKSMYNDAKAEE
ncbi:Ppx/GppA phosphatase family protein [Mesonia sp. K7]|uniref:Ppx/GppA phosphatase family protein n=1 Tax=Mesonia sp. K7 TaxID=2218606 RepID=UPI000DA7F845|nr:exopolyphosphatase [Mesonia sp. K7]PZD79236.1 exopolyphosphatase [Mesonia sp. K7]